MSKRKRKLKNWIIAGLGASILIAAFIFEGPIKFLKWPEVYDSFQISGNLADAEKYPMSVHIFAVGAADSIYVRCEETKILIDAGERTSVNKAKEYLKSREVQKIDLAVATHPHSDHIGGMTEDILTFDMERFWMPDIPEEITPTNKIYESMLLALKEKKVNVQKPRAGETLQLGPLKITVLAPLKQYDDLNNNSLVLMMTYKEIKFLFMGDAEKKSESDIMAAGVPLHADVIKAGHHGSATSSTEKFLEKVKPTYAVISVGESSAKLPKKSVTDRLAALNIKTFRTDLDGTVVFATDGEKLEVFKEK